MGRGAGNSQVSALWLVSRAVSQGNGINRRVKNVTSYNPAVFPDFVSGGRGGTWERKWRSRKCGI